MILRKHAVVSVAAVASAVMFAFAGAASALSVSCAGTPSATNITWNATASSGIAPFTFLWSNGATSSSQVVAVTPGTYSLNIQATDASSTVATSTCSATVNQQAPTINSFTATPSTITVGQSAVLSWNVTGASSTSINQGLGTISSTSITVTPTATTVYTLSAMNPGGTVTANATVNVQAAPTSTSTPGVSAQILALLNQINALKAQIAQLLIGQVTGGMGTSTSATSTPMGCFSYWRDLKRGDKGDDVRELQQELAHNDASLFPPGLINGVFGPKTEAALKMLQRRFGIDISGTGYFGMKSRTFFKSQCSDGDNDHDGIKNSADADDDNDGIPDLQDPKPFTSATATSTASHENEHKDKNEDNHDNNGHGNDH